MNHSTAEAAGFARPPRSLPARPAAVPGSLPGAAVLHLALGWAATGHGGPVAALAVVAAAAPRLLLLLTGTRRFLLAGDVVMIAVTVALGVAAFRMGTAAWLLTGAGLVTGLAGALRPPASVRAPRPAGPAARRAALRLTVRHLTALVCGMLVGAVVAAAGLPGAAAAGAALFGIVGSVTALPRAVRKAISGGGAIPGTRSGVRPAPAAPVRTLRMAGATAWD